MKICPKCHVKVLNNRLTCPLCHTVLEVSDSKERCQEYPKYQPPVEKYNMAKRMIMFWGLIAIIVSIVINYLTFDKKNPDYWSSIVTVGIILGLVITLITILSKLSITIKVLTPMVFVELLILTIEINSKKYWSFYYLVPFLIIVFLIVIFILHLSLEIKGRELVVSLLFFDIAALVFSLVALIKKVRVSWTYMTLLTFSVIMLLVIFFFLGKTLKEELAKKMHI